MKRKISITIQYLSLVVFLQSGIIKGLLLYYVDTVSFDVTSVSLLLFVIASVFNLENKRQLKINGIYLLSIVILFCFFLWIWISSFFSISQVYSITKVQLFILNLLSFSSILCFKNFQIKIFIEYSVFILLVSLLFYFPVLITYNLGLIPVEKKASYALYLMLGFSSGLIILLSHMASVAFLQSKIVLLLVFAIMTIIGARGSSIFFIISIFLIYIGRYRQKTKFNLHKTSYSLFKFLLIFGLIVSIFNNIDSQNWNSIYERAVNRFAFLGIDNSSDERIEHIHLALALSKSEINTFLLGYGTGSYGILSENIDERAYPHNIFLEILVENGVLGLLMLVSFFVLIIYAIQNKQNRLVCYSIVLFILLNLLKSFSIVDIRNVFFILSYLIKSEKNS